MDTLRGKVSNVRHTTDVHGQEGIIATTHVALFDLDGTAVRFEGDAAANIDDADEVAVAGYHRRGTFRTLAFRNLTKKTEGSRLAVTYFIIGLGLVLYGFFAVLLFQSLASVVWGDAGGRCRDDIDAGGYQDMAGEEGVAVAAYRLLSLVCSLKSALMKSEQISNVIHTEAG